MNINPNDPLANGFNVNMNSLLPNPVQQTGLDPMAQQAGAQIPFNLWNTNPFALAAGIPPGTDVWSVSVPISVESDVCGVLNYNFFLCLLYRWPQQQLKRRVRRDFRP
jgi:hypothetical protein